jgi:nucleotide-binding universal stress UspA family protein
VQYYRETGHVTSIGSTGNSSFPLPVVVGVDDAYKNTITWAVEEATSRRTSLRLVCAYGWAVEYGPHMVKGPLPPGAIADIRSATDKLLHEAADYAATIDPALEITQHASGDNPVPALLQESAQASVLVLGARQLSALGSMLLGSVSASVAARAECPVVVLHGSPGLAGENRAVVVGVDPRDGSPAALRFAFDHASRHALPVHAVMCWRRDPLSEMLWRASPPAPERAEELLSEALAGWRAEYPDVTVHSGVERDHPAAGLVAAAAGQDLLVVGSRGHHAAGGTLLGSVSQAVLHHATCPVAVVPHLR